MQNYIKTMLGTCCLVILSGCASMPAAKVEIPASLLQQCPELNKLEGTTGADLLKNIVSNAQLYHTCADAHAKLIEAAKPKK